jgi:hypothetical protein
MSYLGSWAWSLTAKNYQGATGHASGEEAVLATFIVGNATAVADGGRTAPTIKGPRIGSKGGNKGQKRQPHHVTVVASNGGGGEGAGDSSEEYVEATKCNFKGQTRPPKVHFKKLLEATCPHHSYPIKHKLKDCTLMKKFMMSGAFSKDRKLGGDPGGKSATPILGEADVMTIFDRPHRGPKNITWLVEPRILNSL